MNITNSHNILLLLIQMTTNCNVMLSPVYSHIPASPYVSVLPSQEIRNIWTISTSPKKSQNTIKSVEEEVLLTLLRRCLLSSFDFSLQPQARNLPSLVGIFSPCGLLPYLRLSWAGSPGAVQVSCPRIFCAFCKGVVIAGDTWLFNMKSTSDDKEN